MNEATQRMFSAGLLTLALHSIFFAWHPQPPVHIELPAPQRIAVHIQRPLPKKTIRERLPALPRINPAQHKPIPHLPPAKGKVARRMRRAPALHAAPLQRMPHLPPAQGRIARRLLSVPTLNAASVPPPLPDLPAMPEEVLVEPAQMQETTAATEPEDVVWAEEEPAGVAEEESVISAEDVAGSARGGQEAVPLYDSNPPPEYPFLARRRGLQGVVILEALIDRSGQVSDLRLFTSSGHNILDNAALKSVRGWLFKPGAVDGQGREMWVKVPVRFTLH